MDSKKFSPDSPGHLVSVEVPTKDWAFIPADLPADWKFPSHLWPLLVEAREALGTLNGIGQTLPSPELLLRPLQTQEAISSSSIEGTYVTAQELLLFGLDPREPSSGDDKKADWFEVFNYRECLKHGISLLSELQLCNRLILEMHERLMRGVRGREKSPGKFRRCAVQIGSSGRFVPAPWTEVERLMSNLEKYTNDASSDIDPLVRCFIIHYQFETIHPFRDGNGRVGRALLALMVQHWLSHRFPWLYLSAYFEKFKDEYIDKLFNISAKGEWDQWIEFCLRATVVQAKDAAVRCHRFQRLRSAFKARVNSHSPRTHKIIDSLFEYPVVSISSLADKLGVIYHTARSDIERLIESGILVEISNQRPRSFCAPEVMEIAYGEIDYSDTDRYGI